MSMLITLKSVFYYNKLYNNSVLPIILEHNHFILKSLTDSIGEYLTIGHGFNRYSLPLHSEYKTDSSFTFVLAEFPQLIIRLKKDFVNWTMAISKGSDWKQKIPYKIFPIYITQLRHLEENSAFYEVFIFSSKFSLRYPNWVSRFRALGLSLQLTCDYHSRRGGLRGWCKENSDWRKVVGNLWSRWVVSLENYQGALNMVRRTLE